MIKISSAAEKDNLDLEWDKMNIAHYGQDIKWIEKKYRFKATDNGKIVGTVSGKFESGVVYISALITAEKYRGQGIGSLLVQKVEDFGKKYGAHQIWLVTGKNWSENNFYQKLGFTLTGNLPDFYFHTDFVLYTRPIKY